MAKRMAIGIIGAGNISLQYLALAPSFANLKVAAIADIVPAAAKARAEQFAGRAMTVDELLKDDEIELVINLTVPAVHYAVTPLDPLGRQARLFGEAAGALRQGCEEARRRGRPARAEARWRARHVLGAAAQTARKLIDKGAIGRVIAGTAYVMGHGMENWHPSPGFFFRRAAARCSTSGRITSPRWSACSVQ